MRKEVAIVDAEGSEDREEHVVEKGRRDEFCRGRRGIMRGVFESNIMSAYGNDY